MIILFQLKLIVQSSKKSTLPTKLKLSTVNIQSIKSKDDDLLEYLLETKTDLCIVTKTWLNDENEEDGVWVSIHILTKFLSRSAYQTGKTVEVEAIRSNGLQNTHGWPYRLL